MHFMHRVLHGPFEPAFNSPFTFCRYESLLPSSCISQHFKTKPVQTLGHSLLLTNLLGKFNPVVSYHFNHVSLNVWLCSITTLYLQSAVIIGGPRLQFSSQNGGPKVQSQSKEQEVYYPLALFMECGVGERHLKMAKPTYKGYLLCRRKNETFTLKCTLHAARQRWVAWQMTSHICQSCKLFCL